MSFIESGKCYFCGRPLPFVKCLLLGHEFCSFNCAKKWAAKYGNLNPNRLGV